MSSKMLHWWVRNPSRALSKCSCVYHGKTKDEGYGHVKSIQVPPPPPLMFCWPFQGGTSAVVYYFCHYMYLHVCPSEMLILDSRLASFWERNWPFGFLLVVFWLWCRCFRCVLLSIWCLVRKVLGNCINCINIWLLPSRLFIKNCVTYFWLKKKKKCMSSALEKDLNSCLLNRDISCFHKQCRSRSVGFFRSQLIWICTVCHLVCDYVSTTWNQVIWLADN